LVAQDKPLLRAALAALLREERSFQVVAEAGRGDEVLATAVGSRPHVALLDVNLPGPDVLAIAAHLCETLPNARALVLTDVGRCAVLSQALEGHPHRIGFVTTAAPPGRLLTAIHRTALGEQVIDPELVLAAFSDAGNPLSARERQLLSLVARGAPVREIAAQLFLSPGTVSNYLSRIDMKLGARTRIDAIRIAREAGWL
jgi:two-component system response regulator DesR